MLIDFFVYSCTKLQRINDIEKYAVLTLGRDFYEKSIYTHYSLEKQCINNTFILIMITDMMNLADGDDKRRLGESVERFMKEANLTTEWVREMSHFGNSTFTRFKKANYNM